MTPYLSQEGMKGKVAVLTNLQLYSTLQWHLPWQMTVATENLAEVAGLGKPTRDIWMCKTGGTTKTAFDDTLLCMSQEDDHPRTTLSS